MIKLFITVIATMIIIGIASILLTILMSLIFFGVFFKKSTPRL